MLPISVVVCTLNSQDTILEVVQSLLHCNVEEIIIVDGRSTDLTLEIVKNLGCKITHDERRGLAAARNLGVSLAKSRFILFCGADNVLGQNLVMEMYQTLISNKEYAGIGCLTRVERTGLLSKMLDIQWSARVIAGRETVLGTPSIFEKSLLNEYSFDESRTWSDDEELCQRIEINTGKSFQIINMACLEIGQNNLRRLFYRFKGYGRSDFEVFSANRAKWTLFRKLKSCLHPFDTEINKVFHRVRFIDFLAALPLLVFATFIRYLSWFNLALRYSTIKTSH